jgi:uncharacterized protein (TIGR03382 family)
MRSLLIATCSLFLLSCDTAEFPVDSEFAELTVDGTLSKPYPLGQINVRRVDTDGKEIEWSACPATFVTSSWALTEASCVTGAIDQYRVDGSQNGLPEGEGLIRAVYVSPTDANGFALVALSAPTTPKLLPFGGGFGEVKGETFFALSGPETRRNVTVTHAITSEGKTRFGGYASFDACEGFRKDMKEPLRPGTLILKPVWGQPLQGRVVGIVTNVRINGNCQFEGVGIGGGNIANKLRENESLFDVVTPEQGTFIASINRPLPKKDYQAWQRLQVPARSGRWFEVHGGPEITTVFAGPTSPCTHNHEQNIHRCLVEDVEDMTANINVLLESTPDVSFARVAVFAGPMPPEPVAMPAKVPTPEVIEPTPQQKAIQNGGCNSSGSASTWFGLALLALSLLTTRKRA